MHINQVSGKVTNVQELRRNAESKESSGHSNNIIRFEYQHFMLNLPKDSKRITMQFIILENQDLRFYFSF